MQAVNLKGSWYFCHGCGKAFQGEPEEKRFTDRYLDEDTLVDDIIEHYSYVKYRCHDGNPPGSDPCSVDDDDLEQYYDPFQCGNCKQLFPDVGNAMTCCDA